MKNFTVPATEEEIESLAAGEIILLSGEIFTARDQAHLRLANAIRQGQDLPFDLKKAAVYYCGPTPPRNGEPIGSCGPTTSGRMDDYTPLLMENGLKITIGKGQRSPAVADSIKKHKGVYLTAVGGAAALMKSRVLKSELVAYGDLGCEAVYKLLVKDMPLIVTIDSCGNT